VRQMFRWTGQTVAARGWGFEVWSGVDAVLLENVRFLAGYRRPQTVDNALLPLALHAARRSGTVGELEQALGAVASSVRARPAILHLLWAGALATDLSAPLTTCSRIWAGEGGLQ
jgi:hypothetical protein